MDHSNKMLSLINGHLESHDTAKLKPVDDGNYIL